MKTQEKAYPGDNQMSRSKQWHILKSTQYQKKSPNIFLTFFNVYIAEIGSAQDAKSYSVQHFTTKLKKEFSQNENAIKTDGTKKTVIWNSASMSLTLATHLAKQHRNLEANIIWKCASKLRNDILPLESVKNDRDHFC